jgi:hypothetical protein
MGDLIYQCGHITHVPSVCRRCGPVIVHLARPIGINVPADHGSPVFDRALSNLDPPGIARIAPVAEAPDGCVIARNPHAIAATRHSVNVVETDQASPLWGSSVAVGLAVSHKRAHAYSISDQGEVD